LGQAAPRTDSLSADPPSGNLFSSAASQALGVLGLRWRLFDFGRVDAQIAAARGQEAEALAAYRLAVLRATEDVENAIGIHRSDVPNSR
jgi:outer membrane protein TolC